MFENFLLHLDKIKIFLQQYKLVNNNAFKNPVWGNQDKKVWVIGEDVDDVD